MAFAAPFWLFGLIPWTALAVWVLAGQTQRERVPFLPLWRGTPARRDQARRFQAPPLALVAALLAIFLALLGAARPTTNVLSKDITVIVDRGLTMSGREGDVARFVVAARHVEHSIPASARVELVDPIDRSRRTLTGADWVNAVKDLKLTAIDNSPSVIEATRDALRRSAGDVVVLTDRSMPIIDDRMVIVGAKPLSNIGIKALAARETPSPQVMVSIRNHSTARQCTLRVMSGDHTVTRKLDLAEGDSNAFVDLPSLAEIVEVNLENVTDDLTANHAAFLVKHGESPRVEVRSAAVGQAVRRMAEVYGQHRPGKGKVIAIAASQDELGNDAGAVVAEPQEMPVGSDDVRVVDDPITRIVDWRKTMAKAASKPPRGEGWTPVVSIGDAILVARRESPARQVWIGFDQQAWAQSPDFVVFWTNVFQWIGGDDATWQAMDLVKLSSDWKPQTPLPAGAEENAWPGVYRNGAGDMLAMNAAPVKFEEVIGKSELHFGTGRGESKWGAWMLFASVILGATAAAFWGRGRRQVTSI
jgi:hypothetical protein